MMKRYIVGPALAVALFGAGQAQALLIDQYDVINLPQPCPVYFAASGQCVSSPPVAGEVSANQDTGLPYASGGFERFGVIGGVRDLSIVRTSPPLPSVPPPGPVATAGVEIDGVNGLNFSNPATSDSSMTLVYDGDIVQGNFGMSLGGGAGVDLTSNDLDDAFATFPDGTPVPSGAATHLRWHITSLDINLLAIVTLKDADGTVAGNAFLKLPGETDPAIICVTPNEIVCVQPTQGHQGPPGNLYHGLSLFNTGGIDPARPGVSFFDDPNVAGPDMLLMPTGGTTAGLDLTKITAIRVSFDTTGNPGSPGIDVTETCFDTTPLLGTPVRSDQQALAGNNIGSGICSASAIPEPSTVLLMGTGLLGVGLFGVRSHFSRRRRQA